MKKHQTAKYKKRHKKELANRKAKLGETKEEQRVARKVVGDKVLADELGITEPKPISPARRAFQDV